MSKLSKMSDKELADLIRRHIDEDGGDTLAEIGPGGFGIDIRLLLFILLLIGLACGATGHFNERYTHGYRCHENIIGQTICE